MYDRLKIHREEYHKVYSSDTYWIIWNTLLDDECNFVSICNKMQIKFVQWDAHKCNDEQRYIGVIIMHFQSVIMMMISVAYFLRSLNFYSIHFVPNYFSTISKRDLIHFNFQQIWSTWYFVEYWIQLQIIGKLQW